MKKLVALILTLSMLLAACGASAAILDNGRYDKLVVAIDGDPQDLEGDDVNVGSRYFWIYGMNVKLIHSMLGGEFFTQRPAIRLAHLLTGSGK